MAGKLKDNAITAVTPDRDHPSRMSYVDRSLAVACTQGREAVVTRFRAMLLRNNLSDQQWRILRVLYDSGVMTSVEISTRSCIHKVSVSRILKSLEGRNLVHRVGNSSDARASDVSLTEAGKAWLQPMIAKAAAIHDSIAADLGRDKYEQLLGLLRDLARINDA